MVATAFHQRLEIMTERGHFPPDVTIIIDGRLLLEALLDALVCREIFHLQLYHFIELSKGLLDFYVPTCHLFSFFELQHIFSNVLMSGLVKLVDYSLVRALSGVNLLKDRHEAGDLFELVDQADQGHSILLLLSLVDFVLEMLNVVLFFVTDHIKFALIDRVLRLSLNSF